MKISWIKYLIVGIILTIIIFYSSIAIYNFVVNNVPLMDTEKCLSYEPVSGFNNLSDYSLKPSPATIAEASASIRQFSGSSGNVQYMSTTIPRPQVILYQFDTDRLHSGWIISPAEYNQQFGMSQNQKIRGRLLILIRDMLLPRLLQRKNTRSSGTLPTLGVPESLLKMCLIVG